MCVKWDAEVPTLARSRFVCFCLVGRHFKHNKRHTKKPERGKLKTCKIGKHTYPVKMEILQNNLRYILNEMTKNQHPTIPIC